MKKVTRLVSSCSLVAATRAAIRAAVAVVVLVSAALPTPAATQPAIAASAGAASYDLSGVGTSGVAAVRLELPLRPGVEVQMGTGFFWYGTQFDREIAMLLPEVGIQTRPPIGIPLLFGAGFGHTLGVKGSPDDAPTLYVAAGLDIEDRAGWAIRPEIRIRAVDPWTGTIGDFTLGVRRRLGG